MGPRELQWEMYNSLGNVLTILSALPPSPCRAYRPTMEQNENIVGPIYSIRVRDIRRWHLMTGQCGKCRHHGPIRFEHVAWDQPRNAYVTDLEPKLRCTACGNRQGNLISIRMAPR